MGGRGSTTDKVSRPESGVSPLELEAELESDSESMPPWLDDEVENEGAGISKVSALGDIVIGAVTTAVGCSAHSLEEPLPVFHRSVYC
jgi:hypothetical protein